MYFITDGELRKDQAGNLCVVMCVWYGCRCVYNPCRSGHTAAWLHSWSKLQLHDIRGSNTWKWSEKYQGIQRVFDSITEGKALPWQWAGSDPPLRLESCPVQQTIDLTLAPLLQIRWIKSDSPPGRLLPSSRTGRCFPKCGPSLWVDPSLDCWQLAAGCQLTPTARLLFC